MPHPLIEQVCRVPGVAQCQPHFFNRLQRELRDVIQPLLDERDRLIEENAALREDVLRLTAAAEGRSAKRAKATAVAEPV